MTKPAHTRSGPNSGIDHRVTGLSPAERRLYLAVDALAYFAEQLVDEPGNPQHQNGLKESRLRLRQACVGVINEQHLGVLITPTEELHARTRLGMGE